MNVQPTNGFAGLRLSLCSDCEKPDISERHCDQCQTDNARREPLRLCYLGYWFDGNPILKP